MKKLFKHPIVIAILIFLFGLIFSYLSYLIFPVCRRLSDPLIMEFYPSFYDPRPAYCYIIEIINLIIFLTAFLILIGFIIYKFFGINKKPKH